MNNILIYHRPQKSEAIAAQTSQILSEQLQLSGNQTDICTSLNVPRLLLNPYKTIHLIIECMPLTVHEAFHMAVAKALGKSIVFSLLNSETGEQIKFLNYLKPDAFSVSQTNHLKLYRNLSSTKFILSGFPKTDSLNNSLSKTTFKYLGHIIPLRSNIDEVFNYKINTPVYFDGRLLLKKNKASALRKKWSELIRAGRIKENFHLILSEYKIKNLLNEGGMALVLANPILTHTEMIEWLNQSLNKNNMIVLNEYQATGFSHFWKHHKNCWVLEANNWTQKLSLVEFTDQLTSSTIKASELFEPMVNELSRLYSKLWHQKTSLLTSGSVKL